MRPVLDLGCGNNKHPGSIGVDNNPATDADVICNLDRPPYPFRDSSFNEIRATHLVEHVENVIKLVEEVHRLLRPGGVLYIITPHYTDSSSFCDPTHRWHLNSYSFYYFTEPRRFGFYSSVRFHERHTKIQLMQVWQWMGLQWLVNHWGKFRKFWENYLCFVIRGRELHFWFEAIKPDQMGVYDKE